MKTYFELGVKLATSRWRELARAGELSEGAIDRIRKLLGYTAKAVPRRAAAFVEQLERSPFGLYDLSCLLPAQEEVSSGLVPGQSFLDDRLSPHRLRPFVSDRKTSPGRC